MERYCIEHEAPLVGGFCTACLDAGLTRGTPRSVAMLPEQFEELRAMAAAQPIRRLFRASLAEVRRQRAMKEQVALAPELRRCPLESTGCGPDCELGKVITRIATSYDDRSDERGRGLPQVGRSSAEAVLAGQRP